MTRIGPQKTRGEQMAEAFDMAERLFPGKHWMFGKGKTRPDEPLFGFAVFHSGEDDDPYVCAEHDDPIECVFLAVDYGRRASQ